MAERFFEDKTNEYGYTVKVVKPHNWLHIGFFIVIIELLKLYVLFLKIFSKNY